LPKARARPGPESWGPGINANVSACSAAASEDFSPGHDCLQWRYQACFATR